MLLSASLENVAVDIALQMASLSMRRVVSSRPVSVSSIAHIWVGERGIVILVGDVLCPHGIACCRIHGYYIVYRCG